MKALFTIIAALSVGLAAGFSFGHFSRPKENFQQAYDSDLAQGQVFILTLRALDSGDARKTRGVAMTCLFMNLDSAPDWAAKCNPTPDQKQEMVVLAREALDYMLQHRDELDPQRLSVQSGVRGLKKILSDAVDIQHLSELTNYLATVQGKASAGQKP